MVVTHTYAKIKVRGQLAQKDKQRTGNFITFLANVVGKASVVRISQLQQLIYCKGKRSIAVHKKPHSYGNSRAILYCIYCLLDIFAAMTALITI